MESLSEGYEDKTSEKDKYMYKNKEKFIKYKLVIKE